MASAATDSALDLVNLLREGIAISDSVSLMLVEIQLRTLRTFLKCATRWSEINASLASFLSTIEEAVYKNAEALYRLCDEIHEATDFDQPADDFREKMKPFLDEIIKVYNTLLEYNSMQSSSPPTKEDLIDIIDSLRENLKDIVHGGFKFTELSEDFQEKLVFLKNFIRFANWTGVEYEQLEDLLTHVEAVAIRVAQFLCSLHCADFRVDECKYQISEPRRKINPVEPQVRETYIQVLIKASKSSGTLSSQGDHEHIVRDFLDSLRGNLWEILISGNFCAESAQDKMLLRLYGELNFLRSLLSDEQQDKFDELNEQTKDLIGAVVSQAGIVICLLFVKEIEDSLAEEMNLKLFGLIKRIKLIQAEVAEIHPATTRFNFPRINELGFINCVVENLTELVNTGSIDVKKDQIKEIHEDLILMRSFLVDIAEQRSKHEELQSLWSRVLGVACEMELFINSLVIGDTPIYSSMLLAAITEEMTLLKTESSKFQDSKKYDFGADTVPKTTSQMLPQVRNPIMNEVVVGFDEEAKTIIDRLARGSAQLDIVSIIGMPGLGKTTLAKKVYNDPTVDCYFHVRAWSCVSQEYRKKIVLLDILEGILVKLPDRFHGMNVDDLLEELYRSLKRKRYLLILDDVWDIEVWNDLGRAFPNDSNGSRILLTSRLQNVAMHAKPDSEPHLLRSLTESESWELLQKKLFREENCPPPLREVGMEIAKKCKGLPFSVVIVAGILATMEQDKWIEVVGSLSSEAVCGTEEGMSTLELSYKHLPYYLKPCLLYFGVFKQDRVIPTRRLLWLWEAEGFVPKSELKSLDDVAEDYLMDLIDRSLVLVAQQSSRDKVKGCHIHDLLHQFCLEKIRVENFAKLLDGYEELVTFYEPRGFCRLCIYSDGEQLMKSRLICSHAYSLLFFNTDINWHARGPFNLSFIFLACKVLRVLDLRNIRLGEFFPSEIELLVQLRYLAICGEMYFIPSSISNLRNLETFIVEAFDDILLPDAIWNMKKLRHLHINKVVVLDLPESNLENCGLCNLDSFSTPSLHFGPETERIMRMVPNIRRLRCIFYESQESTQDRNQILPLDFLSRLESLKVLSTDYLPHNFEFSLPRNLKKLTFSDLRLPWSKISSIGKLPNLEVLKLLEKAFRGEAWEVEEGEFPKLRYLKLKHLGIVRWTTTGDYFLSELKKIVVDECWGLEELPSDLGYYPALETIEVNSCRHPLVSLVKQIQEEQMDLGNEGLNILIQAPVSEEEFNSFS